MKKESRKTILCRADLWILIVAAILLALFALHEMTAHTANRPLTRALLLVVICLLFYAGGYLLAERTGNQRILKGFFLLFFFLYLYLLLSFTLLDPSMGRGDNSVYDQIEQTRKAYVSRFVNLVPLRSIYHVYIKGFLGGYVNAYYTLLNLLGNIFALMPLAFFLPYFFPAQKKWYLFLPTVLLTVILIEALQYLFMIGSCDIDDLILNAGGAFLFFLFLKLPFMIKLLDRLTKIKPKKS